MPISGTTSDNLPFQLYLEVVCIAESVKDNNIEFFANIPPLMLSSNPTLS